MPQCRNAATINVAMAGAWPSDALLEMLATPLSVGALVALC